MSNNILSAGRSIISCLARYGIGILVLLVTGCSFDCGVPKLAGSCDCTEPVEADRVWLVQDFEGTDLPLPAGCTALRAWSEALDSISLAILDNSRDNEHFAALYLQGNTGTGPQNWSGGGLVLPLTACAEGMDLIEYDSLLFDVRMLPGSRLENLTISLRDTSRRVTPRRQVRAGAFQVDTDWRTARIALAEFTVLRTSELGHTAKLDLGSVIELETQNIHNGTVSHPVDGELQLDNVRFVRK